MKISQHSKAYTINCRGKLLDLEFPKIMGILNVTPDSFSDGGTFFSEKNALLHAEKMLAEGATIIDVGAQSTRPNARLVSAQEEMARLKKIISSLKKNFPNVFISLDTFYAETLQFGYDEGIDIVNDISGGDFDQNYLEIVSNLKLPYILMHSNASYEKMHEKISYSDLLLELNFYFSKKTKQLQEMGIKDILIDPGFGFGKTIEDQHLLIDDLQYLTFQKYPVLIGISRKSFIYKPLGKSPMDINDETQKLHLKCLKNGAKILRVHDVAEAKKTIDNYLI